MSMFQVSRRQLMGLLGFAAVAVPARFASADSARRASGSRPAPPAPVGQDRCPLLEPLVVGSRLGRWTVVCVAVAHAGAVTVGLADASRRRFFVDVCARDSGLGALRAPAHTDRYDLFLANSGDGNRPSREDDGQAALALAEIVKTNEHRVLMHGMLTMRDRLARFRDQVGRAYIPA